MKKIGMGNWINKTRFSKTKNSDQILKLVQIFKNKK